jgi:iron complex outermembrane receptor protein
MAMRMINWAGDGNGYVGNLELEPEVAHTISASFDWRDASQDKWSVKLMPYYTDIEDYIDVERIDSTDTSTDAYVYLRFVNQSAHLYGADLSAHYRLADNLRLNGMLAYTKGKNDTTGDNLYNIMPLNARLALVQSKASWSNTAEFEWVDAKEDVSAVRNEMQTESYSLLHLRSSYTWKQARFDVGVENVLDKFYNHPLGGTYMGQGKTMSGTGVAWGTPVPGMGRSLYAGVNIKF